MTRADDFWCRICGKSTFTLFGGPHVCPPKWTVTFEGGGEYVAYAHSADVAVVEATERYDCDCEMYLVRDLGDRVTAVAVKESDGSEETFVVEGEMVPNYRAWPK